VQDLTGDEAGILGWKKYRRPDDFVRLPFAAEDLAPPPIGA
jgi:hypothetical protein